MKRLYLAAAAWAALAMTMGAAHAAAPATVDFSQGMQDWQGERAGARGAIDTTLGNGTPSFHVDNVDYGFQIGTRTNADFLGNYTAYQALTLSLDMTATSIAIGNPGGAPITESVYVELRDYDKPSAQGAYSVVWFKMGEISGDGATRHLSVTIADTSADVLPAGWHGFGDYDQDGNDSLPYGQTFRRLLTDVDEVVFGTVLPGGYQGSEIYYNLAVDNLAIQAAAVPEPAPVAMFGMGLGLLGLVAARRRQARTVAPEGAA